MKKLMGGIAALIVAVAMTTVPANAQTWAGGGLIYGTDMGDFDLGVQAGAYVGMEDLLPGLRIGGDIEFYFPQSGEGFSANLMALNGNGQYFFLMDESFEIYGIGGLSFTRFSVSNGGSASDSGVGLNLGAGAEFPMDFGRVYAEVKLVTGDYDRVVLGGGVRFGL